jgi:hypothetical protein
MYAMQDLMTAPWIKFIPVLVPVLLLFLTLQGDRRKKGWVQRLAVPLLSLIAALVTCGILWWDAIGAKRSKETAEKWQAEAGHWQAEARNQMNRIEGRLGDGEMTQRYLTAVSRLTHQYVAEQTGSAVEKYFNSQPERDKLRDEARQANLKIALGHRLRVEPIYDLVVQKFDEWIEAVRKRGIKLDVHVEEEVAIMPVVSGRRSGGYNVRVVSFERGAKLFLQMSPAIVDDSQFVQNLHFQMPFIPGGSGGSEVWTLNIYEKTYSLQNARPNRFSFVSFEGAEQNPIEDQKFVALINQSLDEVMGYVIQEATTPTN